MTVLHDKSNPTCKHKIDHSVLMKSRAGGHDGGMIFTAALPVQLSILQHKRGFFGTKTPGLPSLSRLVDARAAAAAAAFCKLKCQSAFKCGYLPRSALQSSSTKPTF